MIKRTLTISWLVLAMAGVTACGDRKSGPTATSEPVAPAPEQTIPASPSSGPTAATDFTIIPGQRVGPVTSATSRQDLATIYGEAALQDEPVPMGEGTTEPGTVVNLTPERRFAVVWLDLERSRPLLAKDFGPASENPRRPGGGGRLRDLESGAGAFSALWFWLGLWGQPGAGG
ncbi:MAG: hypothetical protein HC922_10940 [Leptolyngbyaceae cyanobacterium SM2_3_12]|nr:hypothetical protein [Leptolyngbyaceae cyanobacterium SM2_3_12]